jgi:Cu-Zn family superoxide dismutase
MTTRTVCVGLLLSLLPMGDASGEMAKAVVQGTSAESTLTGDVLLTQTEEGLKVNASLAGAPPGLHGFHVHEFGSCAEAGGGAGGHFNPAGTPHGDLLAQGLSGAHAGDLGNIEVEPDGRGSLERVYPGLALSGEPTRRLGWSETARGDW